MLIFSLLVACTMGSTPSDSTRIGFIVSCDDSTRIGVRLDADWLHSGDSTRIGFRIASCDNSTRIGVRLDADWLRSGDSTRIGV